jgi:hypothetical protein
MLMGGCAHKEVTQTADSSNASLPVSEETKEDIPYEAYEARNQVLDYFNPIKGDIENIEDEIIRVRLREEGHVKEGMRLSVFRESEPFYHPVTNELIGNAEEYVGRIEVMEENAVDGLYLCSAIEGDVRTGDKVRISSSRIKLAFFQDRKANWSISEAFYGSLKDSGRFEIVDSFTPDYQPDTLSKVARDLGAEAVLMFSTPVKERKRLLSIKLYWAEDGEILGEIEEESQVVADITVPEEEFISSTFTSREPWGKFALPGGQLIAMGDVDGNGTDDFVISDGREIHIYSIKEDVREMWNIKTKEEGSHLSLDVLDLNNNGRAEIFVTSVVNASYMNTSDSIYTEDNTSYTNENRANSFVIEYDPSEGYKKIEENMPYFLRVNGKTLLMQRYHRNTIFSGPVYRGEWREMHYEPDKPLELPDKANIYGFTFVDWKNEGQIDVITYDDKGYLYLYDHNGNLKWKSDTSFGPFAFSFESRTASSINPTVKWSLRGRLEIVRTDRGLEVVAVSRKPVLKMVPGLGSNESDVYSLWWDGSVMDEELILHRVSGAVTDYWLQGRELFLIAKGSLRTFISNLASGDVLTRSILYYYNFAPLETNP